MYGTPPPLRMVPLTSSPSSASQDCMLELVAAAGAPAACVATAAVVTGIPSRSSSSTSENWFIDCLFETADQVGNGLAPEPLTCESERSGLGSRSSQSRYVTGPFYGLILCFRGVSDLSIFSSCLRSS